MTGRPPATADVCTRHFPKPGDSAPSSTALAVRCQVHLVSGEAGRALAAAQGRALAALLDSLGELEVGQGEEVSP
jgi:hypothetical protein